MSHEWNILVQNYPAHLFGKSNRIRICLLSHHHISRCCYLTPKIIESHSILWFFSVVQRPNTGVTFIGFTTHPSRIFGPGLKSFQVPVFAAILSIFQKKSYFFHLPKFKIRANRLNGCDENSTQAPSRSGTAPSSASLVAALLSVHVSIAEWRRWKGI